MAAAVDGGLLEAEEATLYLTVAKQAYRWKQDATAFPKVVGCAAAKTSNWKCQDVVVSEDYPMPLSVEEDEGQEIGLRFPSQSAVSGSPGDVIDVDLSEQSCQPRERERHWQ
eukprot:9802827-Karenia_brevis.AAC.1